MMRTITPTIGEREDPQVRIADVVEEPLDAVEPRRVRQPDPRREDVGEEQQDVDADEDVQEALDRVGRIREHGQSGRSAHGAGILYHGAVSYA
jgi:hypothetical protein